MALLSSKIVDGAFPNLILLLMNFSTLKWLDIGLSFIFFFFFFFGGGGGEGGGCVADFDRVSV